MKFIFKNIPVESKFCVFDKAQPTSRIIEIIEPGDNCFEVSIPSEWRQPFRKLITVEYFIPDCDGPVDILADEIEITGASYYLDVNRKSLNEELNQLSVETLIHKLSGDKNLDGRQQFFISLVSLQSYFEYLVYGMLVQSGHISKTKFTELETHEERTDKAFSDKNTDFFSNKIKICPRKENLGTIIEKPIKAKLKTIFDKIRMLRNNVVHAWGYKDLPQQKIKDIFSEIEENIEVDNFDDVFFKNAAFIFVRLYAKSNPLKTQLSLFNEKEIVKTERAGRGY